MSKATRGFQSSRIVCGGYKHEADYRVFSDEPNKNMVELLRRLEKHITEVNPFMDNDDKLEIINGKLKGSAGTWWRVISARVNIYEEFQTTFLD